MAIIGAGGQNNALSLNTSGSKARMRLPEGSEDLNAR